MQKNREGKGRKAGGRYIENNGGDWDQVIHDGDGGRCMSNVFENASFFAFRVLPFPDRSGTVSWLHSGSASVGRHGITP